MTAHCPCGHNRADTDCCGRFIDGAESAPSAETLMRSRYTAYARGQDDYLLATWHADTRPALLDLAREATTRWLGLDVLRHEIDPLDPDRAIVEFVARLKVGGERAQRLHEVSRFVREGGKWFYINGNADAAGREARRNLRKAS
jgi:SEC-C motif-containing protein